MKYIVNFSGGRSSACMVNWLLRNEPEKDFIFIFCNTSKETPETYEFIKECVNYFKINLIILEYKKASFIITDLENCKKNGEIFEQLIKDQNFLPNVMMRFCTGDMKIKICRRYLKSLGIKKYINYLGIRADEPQRYSKIIAQNTKNIYFDMPLYYEGWTKQTVNNWWLNMPFDLKHNSAFGNCDLCFLKGKRKLINLIRLNPKKVDWWIKQEKTINATFFKDISYIDLLNLANQPEFNFDEPENEIICNCNLND